MDDDDYDQFKNDLSKVEYDPKVQDEEMLMDEVLTLWRKRSAAVAKASKDVASKRRDGL